MLLHSVATYRHLGFSLTDAVERFSITNAARNAIIAANSAATTKAKMASWVWVSWILRRNVTRSEHPNGHKKRQKAAKAPKAA